MKKTIILLFVLLSKFTFAQNSVETNPAGTLGIITSKGMGTTVDLKGGRINTYATTGSTATTNVATSIYGLTNNSSLTNAGVIGEASGSSNFGYGVMGFSNGVNSTLSAGVLGYSDIQNGTGHGVKGTANMNSIASDFGMGGYFNSVANSNVNGSAKSYGVYSSSEGNGTVAERYGAFAKANGSISSASYGIYAASEASGTGSEYGAVFNAIGTSTGSLKIGVFAQAASSTSVQIRRGVDIRTYGPSTTSAIGVNSLAENSANGITYGGYFEARGTGTGTKYGIYATTSGAGTQYAAILDGKVGIGTNAPTDQLTVQTASNAFGFTHTDGTVTVGSYIPNIFGVTAGVIGTKSNHNLILMANGSYQAYLLANGNFGIGTSSPSSKLTVQTATGTTGITHTDGTISVSTYVGANAGWLGTKSNHPLSFYTNDGGTQATLLTNGNFGIGLTNPTEKLHVSGNVRASGNLIGTGATLNNLTVSSASTFSGSFTVNNTITANDGFFSGSLGVGGVLSPDVLNVGGISSPITKIKRTTLTGQQIFGVVNNTCDLDYYNVPGVLVGDNVILNIDSPFSTLAVSNVRVSAADTVEVKFCNMGNSNTVLLTGLTFRFMYYR